MPAARKSQPPITIDQVIATRVREIRTARGWSQPQLAEALTAIGSKIHDRQAVYRVEKGHQPLKTSQLLEVAAVLAIPPVELLIPRNDDELVQSPWGVLPAWELRVLVDPSDAYMKAAGWDGQYAMGSGLGAIMQRRGELEPAYDVPPWRTSI